MYVHVLRVLTRRNGELWSWGSDPTRLSLSLMRFTNEACARITSLLPLLLGCPDTIVGFSMGRMLYNVDEHLRRVTNKLLVAAPRMQPLLSVQDLLLCLPTDNLLESMEHA